MLTTLKSGYYVGVDGGGTKTEAVIASESGLIIGRGTAGGANIHNIPIDVAIDNIKSAIELAKLDAVKNRPAIASVKFEAACLGLAGIDTLEDRSQFIRYFRSVPHHHWPIRARQLILCNDGFIGLKSGTDENWGVCLISSTGSNCYGVSATGHEATASDWGYLLGDQGSGFAIGLKLIQSVIKEYDGRKSKTLLTPKVLNHLGLHHPTELIAWAYGGRVPVKDIASLTQLYNDPDLHNCIYLAEILLQTVRELQHAYKAIVNRLDIPAAEPFSVVLIGGLFSIQASFLDQIRQAIFEVTPKARIMIPKRSPSEGAVRVAQMSNIKKLFPDSVITYIAPDTKDVV